MGWRGRATNHFQKLPLSGFKNNVNLSVSTKVNANVCILNKI